MKRQSPSVSVVIPAYNEEVLIRKCLLALSRQTVPPLEIIVVDNNSTDHTASVARQYGATVIAEERQGIGYARTAGFDFATGEIIARIDADTMVSRRWIEMIQKSFRADKKLVGMAGSCGLWELSLPGTYWFRFVQRIFRFFHRMQLDHRVPMYGHNMAIRRSVWTELRSEIVPLDAEPNEDMAITKVFNATGKVIFNKKMIVKIHVARSLFPAKVIKYQSADRAHRQADKRAPSLSYLRDRYFEEKFITIKGQSYCYLEANPNSSKTIVMLHGVTGTAEDMTVIGKKWAEKGFRVILPDLPGHRKSAALPVGSIDDLATWLDLFLRTLLERPPEVLVSHSFASAITYTFAARGYLDAETHLFLVCPTPLISKMTHFVEIASNTLPASTARYIYLTRVVTWIRMRYLLTRYASKQAWNWLKESELDKRVWLNEPYATHLSRLLAHDKPYDLLISPDIQSLITVTIGDTDTVAGQEAYDYMRRQLPNSPIELIFHCGHIVHFEAHQWLANRVTKYLIKQV